MSGRPLDRSVWRGARRSAMKFSMDGHCHTSRPCSSVSVGFPKARRPAAAASFLKMPSATSWPGLIFRVLPDFAGEIGVEAAESFVSMVHPRQRHRLPYGRGSVTLSEHEASFRTGDYLPTTRMEKESGSIGPRRSPAGVGPKSAAINRMWPVFASKVSVLALTLV